MALTATYATQPGGGYMPNGEGVWTPWSPTLENGPSDPSFDGSKYTVVDGVFYGHLRMFVPKTSTVGSGPHWGLPLPYRRYNNVSHVIGTGMVWLSNLAQVNTTNLQITGFQNLESLAAVMPLMPYYDTSRFDYASDPDYLYEDFMNTTQARVVATTPAWGNIRSNWGSGTTSDLNILAALRYHIKQ